MSRVKLWGSFIAVFGLCAGVLADDQGLREQVTVRKTTSENATVRFSSGHPDAGLPSQVDPLPVYHADPGHPLNRLFDLLFTADVIPEEINGSLPREVEAGTEADRPWYFRKRVGGDADRKRFGGDIRISPLLTWPEDRSAVFQKTADELLALPETQPAFGLSPLNSLMLQWDLLSVWWRLEQQPGTPPELLSTLAKLIHRTAQSKEVLASLPTGWEIAQEQFRNSNRTLSQTPYFPSEAILSGDEGWVELSRNSTKLFVSPQSLRNSRVFLKLPENGELASWLESQSVAFQHPEKRPPHRIETAMVLSLIGITPELEAVASPVLDEIRFRTVFGADEEMNLQETTSRDGSTLWLYFIDRQQTLGSGAPRYRFISNDSQSLFLEYGSAKHATYAAQCSLCHRLTNSGNQAIAGVRSLSSIAKATITDDPTARARLAELQMKVVTERLQQRLKVGATPLPPAEFDFRKLPGLGK